MARHRTTTTKHARAAAKPVRSHKTATRTVTAARTATATRTVTATRAQNGFGELMEMVAGETDVIITRRAAPRAVLMSYERYRALAGAEVAVLDDLSSQFDALLAHMQTPAHRSATDRALSATSKKMGAAAVRAATAKPARVP